MSKIPSFAISLCSLLIACGVSKADNIVIMHTNDTHSQIDPAADGKGGVARRKVLIDSIRAAEPHTLLVDAGDAVQGSNYFTLYGGEVEALMLNELGYEYAILGNHEFDNGMESLGKYISSVNAPYIATNYIVTGTPLEGKLTRYKIVPIAGKRIGLIGINIDPKGMIADEKSVGVVYQDPCKAANATAWHLKNNEGVDYVIAITHI
ncbi:MAG: metallophosphoesterase, partial [Muribaculaceae bacterium]|nr:metallophosphoesterase [Muribaculaceae bacterium]